MTHVKYSVRMDPACLFATLVSVSVYIESSHERSAPPIVFAHPHEFRIDNDLPFQLKVDPIKCMNAIVDRSRFRASFSCTALAPSTTISMFFPRRCNMAGEGGGGGGASSVKSASTSSSTSHMSADGEPAVET